MKTLVVSSVNSAKRDDKKVIRNKRSNNDPLKGIQNRLLPYAKKIVKSFYLVSLVSMFVC